jgi:hypothetical protein
MSAHGCPPTQVCRTTPNEKGRYIKIILSLLQSSSTAVVYECAVTLVSLSQVGGDQQRPCQQAACVAVSGASPPVCCCLMSSCSCQLSALWLLIYSFHEIQKISEGVMLMLRSCSCLPVSAGTLCYPCSSQLLLPAPRVPVRQQRQADRAGQAAGGWVRQGCRAVTAAQAKPASQCLLMSTQCSNITGCTETVLQLVLVLSCLSQSGSDIHCT